MKYLTFDEEQNFYEKHFFITELFDLFTRPVHIEFCSYAVDPANHLQLTYTARRCVIDPVIVTRDELAGALTQVRLDTTFIVFDSRRQMMRYLKKFTKQQVKKFD